MTRKFRSQFCQTGKRRQIQDLRQLAAKPSKRLAEVYSELQVADGRARWGELECVVAMALETLEKFS